MGRFGGGMESSVYYSILFRSRLLQSLCRHCRNIFMTAIVTFHPFKLFHILFFSLF